MCKVEYTITDTELQALILGMNLIRSLRPPYNVHLMRSRDFAFVRISLHETYPSVALVHKRRDDGVTYFGPFTNAWSQRRMIGLLRGIFGCRDCSTGIEPVSGFRLARIQLET